MGFTPSASIYGPNNLFVAFRPVYLESVPETRARLVNVIRPNLCIYCLKESTEAPPEHIVPEVLGCPKAAILRAGEVCKTVAIPRPGP